MTLFTRLQYNKSLKQALIDYPVVAVMGPRQCGKTTLVKNTLEHFDYLDLELPSDHAKLSGDIEIFLRSRKKALIIDEAQRCPQLFPVLRALVDEKRTQKGRYILLGSASFQLVSQINESLSGRVAFLDLTPFLYSEVYKKISLEQHWLKGGFPDALLQNEEEKINFYWFENYTRTLIERDLPALGIEVSPEKFRQLWLMCVHFHGNILNMNKIATSIGISSHTVERYLDILEQTFMLRRLQPFSSNTKKRLVKSPKLYFCDSGLFHYFSRILTHEDLYASPERGASFEGYIITQIMGLIRQRQPEWACYFFRTSDDIEIDLLLLKGKKKIAIEIKCVLSPHIEHAKSLIKAKEILGIKQGIIFHLGRDSYPLQADIQCISFASWIKNDCLPFFDEFC